MAIFSSNSISSWILSLRFLLVSTAVLSVAVLLKFSVPVMADFVVSEVPPIYSFVLSWLRPPYLYILVNCIIISIVASSKLQNKVESAQAPLQVLENQPPPLTSDVVEDLPVEYRGTPLSVNSQPPGPSQLIGDGDLPPLEFDPYRITSTEEINVDEAVEHSPDSSKKVNVLKSVRVPERNASMELSFLSPNEKGKTEEKSRVSARIPPRKSVKSSSEASKPLGVSKAKPKRHDTLESTWKTITDGRAMPLTRHLKKADTWDTRHRQNDENTPPPPPRMKKFETFNDRSSSDNKPLSPSPSYMKLRREPSLSQDELNRRVEAFIKKFNEDMRLQRQESLNQYQEMVNGGSS